MPAPDVLLVFTMGTGQFSDVQARDFLNRTRECLNEQFDNDPRVKFLIFGKHGTLDHDVKAISIRALIEGRAPETQPEDIRSLLNIVTERIQDSEAWE